MPPGWRLVLAGGRGYGAEEALLEVGNSPRRADIEVADHVSAARLAGLYGRAAIFAFPSLDEGFGMPLLEAMANGVPVIASNRSSMPRSVRGRGPTGGSGERGRIGARFAHACRRRGLAANVSPDRGLARAREFSWERTVAATWSVYQELLG